MVTKFKIKNTLNFVKKYYNTVVKITIDIIVKLYYNTIVNINYIFYRKVDSYE